VKRIRSEGKAARSRRSRSGSTAEEARDDADGATKNNRLSQYQQAAGYDFA
jgi:hypothetical protein